MKYVVTWTMHVDARSPQQAAQRAREYMIDPSRTQATFSVEKQPAPPQVITVQDPDRSDE